MNVFMRKNKKAVRLGSAFFSAFTALLVFSFSAVEHNPAGMKVYESKCANCHGVDARGDTKVGKMTQTPDLTTAEWKEGTSVPEIMKTLRAGLGKMPKFEGKLSEEELKAVSEYTRKLAKIEE